MEIIYIINTDVGTYLLTCVKVLFKLKRFQLFNERRYDDGVCHQVFFSCRYVKKVGRRLKLKRRTLQFFFFLILQTLT